MIHPSPASRKVRRQAGHQLERLVIGELLLGDQRAPGVEAESQRDRGLELPSPAASRPPGGGEAISPIALRSDEGEALWFLGVLATIKASSETTAGRVAVIEHLAPQGMGSPLHAHRREDEWFYVIEGELTFWVGSQVIEAPAGSFVYGPRDVAHTFVIASPEARFLLVTEPAGFESFMRTLAEPAQARTLPPAASAPPDFERLAAVAAEYGIEILGPPGIPS